MGILQFSLIRPYFRNDKMESTKVINQKLEDFILKQEQFDDALKLIVENNSCAIIVNDAGKVIYSGDGLGASCAFNQQITINDISFVPSSSALFLNELINEEKELSLTLSNTKTNQEMVIYGTKIESDLSNYYLYVNSPLEPIDSFVSFFQNQYVFYLVIVFVLSIIIATVLTNKLAKPIVDMKKSADILGTGNYDVKFKGSNFTEVKELANTLNDATYKLSKVDELRKDLIANVSHDIKTPLTMIKAYSEMIMDISGDNPQKRNEHLEVIIQEADYLDHLVTDMSVLSKLQSGNYILDCKNFNLVEVIREIISLNSALFTQEGIVCEYHGEESVIVYADEIKIKQVLFNFVSNAIKHTSGNSRIIINVKRLDESTRVEVVDNGEGIDEDDIPYIWDRYYKIDKSFRRNQQSTGLGLAIVKAILDAHNASYGVESEKGKGSMFYFELPQENVF